MLDLLKILPTAKSSLSILFSVAVFVSAASAQTTRARVQVSVSNSAFVSVQISSIEPADNWSFRNVVAGALGLGDRVEQFRASEKDRELNVRKLAAGEFRSDRLADKVSYVVKIPPQRPGDFAHVSWLTEETGLLMLADLLPESIVNAQVDFALPAGWRVGTPLRSDAVNSFSIEKVDRQVFLVGKEIQHVSTNVAGMELQVVTSGSWRFDDRDVLKAARKVLEHYLGLTGYNLAERPTVFIAPMPSSETSSEWKAETRGSTVTLLLNRGAPIKNWIPQLGVIFTHELFHLWIPNALLLQGDYDWFFEGFTVYIALQTALKLKLIGFDEFLNTIGRVNDSYLSYEDKQSLLEASETRWTNNNSLVYDKGMLVALLYDLVVRQESQGRDSLQNRYRQLFGVDRGGLADANDVIIKLLNVSPKTDAFTQSYIESKTKIELEKLLPTFGIDVQIGTAKTQLKMRGQLTREQRELWRSLGYKK